MSCEPAQHETVVVLDFGAQYVQLIARKVREQNVYSEILPFSTPVEEILARKPKGIVLSGGPSSVYEEGAPSIGRELFEAGIPVLGICYGQQLMAYKIGGEVCPGTEREYGHANLEIVECGRLLEGLGSEQQVWMSHGDRVAKVPPGFTILACSANAPVAAMADEQRRLYGVQFHPEVNHTPCGTQILRNFLYNACECKGDWEPGSFIEETVRSLREQVGDKRILCALSGGVDSSVAAALLNRAVPDQLTCMFIDHGLLRKGEAESVCEIFGAMLGDRFVFIDASETFLGNLEDVTDPEEKRRIIGNTFIRVFEAESSKLGVFDFIAHGTLYPDVIESGGGATATIKTHHNVGGLPEDMKYTNVEPLRRLFKDEVRKIGTQLGLPEEIVQRQPFPGPGLAVRVPGAVTRERLAIAREADAILREEVAAAGIAGEISQYFVVLLDTCAVGCMGDGRTYAQPVVIRAVTTQDFMTADWYRFSYDLLAKIATRIVNEQKGVNRVLYDITTKPPGTIEWE
ncbi:MAG: glutamine-hydrolyzing GMP synthase [Armatimonadia bacterium]